MGDNGKEKKGTEGMKSRGSSYPRLLRDETGEHESLLFNSVSDRNERSAAITGRENNNANVAQSAAPLSSVDESAVKREESAVKRERMSPPPPPPSGFSTGGSSRLSCSRSTASPVRNYWGSVAGSNDAAVSRTIQKKHGRFQINERTASFPNAPYTIKPYNQYNTMPQRPCGIAVRDIEKLQGNSQLTSRGEPFNPISEQSVPSPSQSPSPATLSTWGSFGTSETESVADDFSLGLRVDQDIDQALPRPQSYQCPLVLGGASGDDRCCDIQPSVEAAMYHLVVVHNDSLSEPDARIQMHCFCCEQRVNNIQAFSDHLMTVHAIDIRATSAIVAKNRENQNKDREKIKVLTKKLKISKQNEKAAKERISAERESNQQLKVENTKLHEKLTMGRNHDMLLRTHLQNFLSETSARIYGDPNDDSGAVCNATKAATTDSTTQQPCSSSSLLTQDSSDSEASRPKRARYAGPPPGTPFSPEPARLQAGLSPSTSKQVPDSDERAPQQLSVSHNSSPDEDSDSTLVNEPAAKAKSSSGRKLAKSANEVVVIDDSETESDIQFLNDTHPRAKEREKRRKAEARTTPNHDDDDVHS